MASNFNSSAHKNLKNDNLTDSIRSSESDNEESNKDDSIS